MTTDEAARLRAVDPRFNVALEASAGTGKTRILVDRYINLLRAGVDPSNILAITFTRKAAAEMRERIMAALKDAASEGAIPPSRWRELRDRTADITISTIDAFCLSLLREFPLEADLDPAFSVADDTEIPRLIDDALDRALRIARVTARDDENVALVFAQLGERRARAGLSSLLNRRLVAPAVLAKYLATGPRDLTVAHASLSAATALMDVFLSMRGGLDAFLESGPLYAAFDLLRHTLRQFQGSLEAGEAPAAHRVQAAFLRVREHFLTQDGEPRRACPYPKAAFANEADWRVHRDLVVNHGQGIAGASAAYRRDVNVLVSRGLARMFAIAQTEYRRTLDAHALLDFADLLLRALDLLRRMEDFAQSRYRLESRYHHVLVDEFQDTSRAQWELVSLLVQSWGEGAGLAETGPLPPSIFIVGDRKQSIYSFRDADVSVLREAARYLEGLRPDRDVRRSIVRSFRAVPPLLAFVNDVCHDIEKTPRRYDAFQYDETDRFPVDGETPGDAALGLVLGDTPEQCAEIVAAEIARLVASDTPVRDRDTGVARAVRAGDIGILFRTRESHREFEAALERQGIRSYVYKGLGFFDSDEIKDMLALIWYLAEPLSDLRAAALLRSRFFRLSDEGLRRLAPTIARSLMPDASLSRISTLDPADAEILAAAQETTARWRSLVERLPPAELVDVILTESAYPFEMGGPRFDQARENLKKMRSLMRRIQNRGYTTLARLAAHLDRLAVGDEANAAIDARDAVNLMTVHAAKGLEFPIVFVVNLARGTGGRRDPVRLTTDATGERTAVEIGDFQSDADEDRGARDREETKRLLYVAMTRARDRLYLGTVLKDGHVAPGRGSLAEVLPVSLLGECHAAALDNVMWRAASGTVHNFRVCPSAPAQPVSVGVPRGNVSRVDDFAPLTSASAPAQSVVSMVRGNADAQAADLAGASPERVAGTLVHRLLQRYGFDTAIGGRDLHETALRMLRPEEVSGVLDTQTVADVVSASVAAYLAMCARADLRALYLASERLHEVPFTLRTGDDTWVRGTIDCLVRTPGHVTVLEFKTGRARAEHHRQLEVYRQAAQFMFPDVHVDARLVYASEAESGRA